MLVVNANDYPALDVEFIQQVDQGRAFIQGHYRLPLCIWSEFLTQV